MNRGIGDAVRACTRSLEEITKLAVSNVTAVEPESDGWHLQVEIVEKRAVPEAMDILGLYDVWLGAEGELLRFSRRSTRRRMDVMDGGAGAG